MTSSHAALHQRPALYQEGKSPHPACLDHGALRAQPSEGTHQWLTCDDRQYCHRTFLNQGRQLFWLAY